jgi:hypothetical protein
MTCAELYADSENENGDVTQFRRTFPLFWGIDETTVAKWERDEHRPTTASLSVVKELFGFATSGLVHVGNGISPANK